MQRKISTFGNSALNSLSPPLTGRCFWTAVTESFSIYDVFVQLSLWMPATDRFSLTLCLSIIRAKLLLYNLKVTNIDVDALSRVGQQNGLPGDPTGGANVIF